MKLEQAQRKGSGEMAVLAQGRLSLAALQDHPAATCPEVDLR